MGFKPGMNIRADGGRFINLRLFEFVSSSIKNHLSYPIFYPERSTITLMMKGD